MNVLHAYDVGSVPTKQKMKGVIIIFPSYIFVQNIINGVIQGVWRTHGRTTEEPRRTARGYTFFFIVLSFCHKGKMTTNLTERGHHGFVLVETCQKWHFRAKK